MNAYEALLDEACDTGLTVKEKPLKYNNGRIKGNRIAIRQDIDTEKEKACVLAEELGHYYTSVGNILDMTVPENRKQERQARLWGASAMGKKDNAIFLDTSDLSFEYAPIVLDGAKIVVTNSMVKHSLVTSAYNDRRNESAQALKDLQTVVDIKTLGDLTDEQFEQYKGAIKDEVARKRGKHAVYENQRTIAAVRALKENDIETFGKLMNASHVSLRDDYETSCPEVDVLVDEAWKIPGVIGSRITGGGFGGCTVSIVKDASVDEFKEKLTKAYEEKVGKTPEFYVVSIGDGPSRLI